MTPSAAIPLLLVWLAADSVLAADSSSSCGGSGSGSTSADCPTPYPQTHLQTILMWDCNGRIRFLPDNPLFNINIDIPMLPSLFSEGLESIEVYLKAHCEEMGDTFNHQELRDRYHPLFAMLYGNELYKGTEATKINCLDFVDGFTRDLRKLYVDLTGKTSFEMPQSCQKDYPKQCSFTHPVMELGADIQVVARQCLLRGDFYQVSIGCEGGGCNVFKPCNDEADCASLDHLTCINPFKWVDPKLTEDLKNATAKFTESDVYDILRDTFKFYDPAGTWTTDPCGGDGTSTSPKKLFKKFIEKFSKYIVGSPEADKVTKSSSCQNGDCTLCLPVHTNAFEAIFSEFPGRWEEITDEYPVNREQIPGDDCSLTPAALVSNFSALHSSYVPAVFTANSTNGVEDPEPPLSRGSEIPIYGKIEKIGGGRCTDHSQCLNGGRCITQQEFCELAVLECDEHILECEYDILNKSCSALANASPTLKNCTCLTFRTVGAATELIYGANCGETAYIPRLDDSMMSNFYTFQKHKWKSRYDPLVFWDGVTAADGEDPFRVRDHWPKFPKLRAPIDEVHIASLQCDNVLQFFQGTDFAIRFHAPYANQLLQFFGEKNYDTWQCRLSSIQVGGQQVVQNPKYAFLASQGIWRPEPWLYAKVWEGEPVAEPPSIMGYSHLLNETFPYTGYNSSKDAPFEMFNSWQLADFGEKLALTGWVENQYIRFAYKGFPENNVMEGQIFFRMEECENYDFSYATFDLTCKGDGCKELTLPQEQRCKTNSDCDKYSCISPLSEIYEQDLPTQMLWGVDRTDAVQGLTKPGLCPSLESYGTDGPVTKLMQSSKSKDPIMEAVQKLYFAMRYPDCSHKEGGTDCWGHCYTYEDAHCLFVPDYEPKIIEPLQEELLFCMPKIYPFYESLVTDLGMSDPFLSGGSGWYAHSLRNTHQPVVDVAVYDISAHIEKIDKPLAYVTESVDPPEAYDEGTTFGKSFIAVMLCMALIVCVSSLCVYYHYVRISKSEKERQQSLHGLTFAYDTEKVLYGRDLMIPDMAKRWLPGEGGVALKKSAVVDEDSIHSEPEEMAPVAPVAPVPDDDPIDNNSHANGWSSQDGKSVRSFKKSVNGRGASDSLSLAGSDASEQSVPVAAPSRGGRMGTNTNGNNNNDWVSSVAPGYAKLLAEREKKYSTRPTMNPIPQNLPIDNAVPLAPPPPGTRPLSLGGGSARSGSSQAYSSPYASGANNSFPAGSDRDTLLQDFTSKPSKPRRHKY